VPIVLWAEREDRIFLTVEISDSKEPKVDITDDGCVSVSATGGSEGVQYALKLELLHPVNSKARPLWRLICGVTRGVGAGLTGGLLACRRAGVQGCGDAAQHLLGRAEGVAGAVLGEAAQGVGQAAALRQGGLEQVQGRGRGDGGRWCATPPHGRTSSRLQLWLGLAPARPLFDTQAPRIQSLDASNATACSLAMRAR
jgi:hypothetical protein